MKTILRYSLVLGILCLVSAGGLAGLYFAVDDRIALKEENAAKAAQEQVLTADAAGVASVEPLTTVTLSDGEERQVVVGKGASGAVVGYATIGEAQGYSSRIEVMVGVSADLSRVIHIKVLKQQETPGLGARMTERPASMSLWQAAASLVAGKKASEAPKAPRFQAQFDDKAFGELEVVTGADAEGIAAMTGATISSRAVTYAVRDAFDIIERAVKQDEPEEEPDR
jgi:electron transport complex protein RnfG